MTKMELDCPIKSGNDVDERPDYMIKANLEFVIPQLDRGI
jgi:hypothetical protein